MSSVGWGKPAYKTAELLCRAKSNSNLTFDTINVEWNPSAWSEFSHAAFMLLLIMSWWRSGEWPDSSKEAT